MNAELQNDRAALNDLQDATGAELTNRLIQDDPDFDNPEWREDGTIDGVPVSIYYRTTPEDQDMVDDNGDWGNVDWSNRIDRAEVDIIACDRLGISDDQINGVVKKYKSGTSATK